MKNAMACAMHAGAPAAAPTALVADLGAAVAAFARVRTARAGVTAVFVPEIAADARKRAARAVSVALEPPA